MAATLFLTLEAAAGVCAGLLFIAAAIAKLRHKATLVGTIANYRLLPSWGVGPVAVLLPWVEIVLGIALIMGERLVAPLVAAALLLVFAGAMVINIRRGRSQIDCGCGIGGMRQTLHPAFVTRNIVLAAALLPGPFVAGSIPATERAVAAVAGLIAFLLLLLLNQLLALPGFRTQTA